jgi:hypothetical protein
MVPGRTLDTRHSKSLATPLAKHTFDPIVVYHHQQQLQQHHTMARSGFAKGANAGHITEQRVLKAKPSRGKGVSHSIVSMGRLIGSEKRERENQKRSFVRSFFRSCVRSFVRAFVRSSPLWREHQ